MKQNKHGKNASGLPDKCWENRKGPSIDLKMVNKKDIKQRQCNLNSIIVVVILFQFHIISKKADGLDNYFNQTKDCKHV